MKFCLNRHSIHKNCNKTEASTTWFCSNEEFKVEKTRSAAADEGCNTEMTLAGDDDQFGRKFSYSCHCFIMSVAGLIC